MIVVKWQVSDDVSNDYKSVHHADCSWRAKFDCNVEGAKNHMSIINKHNSSKSKMCNRTIAKTAMSTFLASLTWGASHNHAYRVPHTKHAPEQKNRMISKVDTFIGTHN